MTDSHLGIADPRRIVVFRALFLGDLLCAVPALDALDRRFPEAEITMIGLPWASEFVRHVPAIDRFVEFAGYPGLPESAVDQSRSDAFLRRIRDERYDLGIQLHGSGETTNELVGGFGAQSTLGYGAAGDDRLAVVLPWREEEHEVHRWLRLLGPLGVHAAGTRINLPVTDGDHHEARHLLDLVPNADGPIVGLHAGAKDESRRWPVERFAELGDALVARFGARIVLTGSAGERRLTEAIQARMQGPALDLAGRTDLGAFLALVGRLDLLVTNDTGASHVAAASGTPSVVLFGPTRPSRWAPLDRTRHHVIDARDHVEGDAPPERPLARLAVGPVLAACERMLGRLDGVARPDHRPRDLVETL